MLKLKNEKREKKKKTGSESVKGKWVEITEGTKAPAFNFLMECKETPVSVSKLKSALNQ